MLVLVFAESTTGFGSSNQVTAGTVAAPIGGVIVVLILISILGLILFR